MNKHFLFSLLFLISLAQSCSKQLPNKPPSFKVQTDKVDFNLTDSIHFNFMGSADFITFYSGEVGHRFQYRDRTAEAGSPILQFTTLRANGSQPNSLKLLISDNFILTPGNSSADSAATITSIKSAVWNDITNRALLSTGTSTPSGKIDLSDYGQKGKSVFIAFKYVGLAGSAYPKWSITGFNITNNLADSTSYLIANMNANTTALSNYGVPSYSPGWVAYQVSNKYNWVGLTGTLTITGASTAGAATSDAENWAIIGPLDLNKVTPDVAVPIKMISENMDKFPYVYQYVSSGKYLATFVATNVNADSQDSSIQQINLNIH